MRINFAYATKRNNAFETRSSGLTRAVPTRHFQFAHSILLIKHVFILLIFTKKFTCIHVYVQNSLRGLHDISLIFLDWRAPYSKKKKLLSISELLVRAGSLSTDQCEKSAANIWNLEFWTSWIMTLLILHFSRAQEIKNHMILPDKNQMRLIIIWFNLISSNNRLIIRWIIRRNQMHIW